MLSIWASEVDGVFHRNRNGNLHRVLVHAHDGGSAIRTLNWMNTDGMLATREGRPEKLA